MVRFFFLNAFGDTLISNTAFYSEWILPNKKDIKRSWISNFKLDHDSLINDVNTIQLSSSDENQKNEILILAGSDGHITFEVTSKFNRPLTLYRHSLVIGFALPVREVYTKSTLIDSVQLQSEYWLDKEGFKLSNQRNSYLVYHPQNISSIQLNVEKKKAFFNLDYCADHPLLHYPLLRKNKSVYEDFSCSVYSKGDSITMSFTLYSVNSSLKLPRMLSNPYGYLSSLIWTEHADYTDIRTNKAVYLGSEKINLLNEATGGFLKYSIPVTKSIFYTNPDNVDNSDRDPRMVGPIATFKETPGYRNFLRLLYESGVEICLHTPDHFTSDRNIISEALDKTKSDFVPATWIDHGYDNSKKSNREDLVCDGADPNSIWYAA
jgi:hypothetical protein